MTEDEAGGRRRERRARVVGVVVALLAMAAAACAIRWPAPGVAIALGIAAYLLARRA